MRAAANSIASGRQSSRPQISVIAAAVGRIRLEARTHLACPLQEHRDGVLARERSKCEFLLPGDAQPGAARHDDLKARARGDDRRERGSGIHDLLEVVDDEQKAPARELLDEVPLEIALEIEQTDGPCDRGNHDAGVADRLERNEDDAVRELLGRRGTDRQREPGLADPAGARDCEEPDLVPSQEGYDLRDALIAPDQRRHGRRHRVIR